MGFIQTKNPDAGLARLIYRMARRAAGGNEELFRKILVADLARAGFEIPKKYAAVAANAAAAGAQAAAPRLKSAAPTVAKVGLAAGVVSAAPAVLAGVAVVGVIGLGVLAWRRYGTWPTRTSHEASADRSSSENPE